MLQIKEELGDTDLEIGPTTLQHMDSHYRTNQEDMSVIKQESATDHNNVDATLCSGVKQELIEIELTTVHGQECAQAAFTPTGAGNTNVNQHFYIEVEVEATDLTAGPTVPRRMDLYDGTNQLNTSIVKTEKSNLTLCSKVEKESFDENKPGDTGRIKKTQPHVYKCDKCPSTFKRNGPLLTHCKRIHGTGIHENRGKYKNRQYLKSKVHDVRSEEQYECMVCKKMCHSKGSLRYHIAQCYGVRSADSKPHLYTCDYCQKTFTIKSSFMYHMTCVHANESYKCDQCNKSFRCEKYLKLHKNNVHTENMKKCNVCGKYVKLVNLRQHMVNVHSDKRRQCKLCGETVKSEHYLRLHLRDVHGREPVSRPATKSTLDNSQHSVESNIFICDYCRKTFTNKTSIKNHMCAHASGSYECNQCKKSFRCEQYLTMHKANMHIARTKKCNVCETYVKPVNMSRHMKRMHSDEQLHCNLCGETVKSKYYFQQHINEHRGRPSATVTSSVLCNDARPSEQRVRSELYSCDKCVQTFTSKDTFRQHCTHAHLAEANKPNECKEKFSLKSYYHNHTSHDGKLHYECAACKKIYISRDGLRKHVTSNHRPRTTDAEPINIFICDYCPKMFTEKLKMKDHITSVHASGSHKCKQCDKSFRCEKYLTNHMGNVHFPHKQECNVCGKLLRPRNLKQHMLSVHSDKKLQCNICGEIMMTTRCLHNHMNDVHGQQSADRSQQSTRSDMGEVSTGNSEAPVGKVDAAVPSASTQQRNIVVKKEEPTDEELELGPVMFQRMDCHYQPYKEEPLSTEAP